MAHARAIKQASSGVQAMVLEVKTQQGHTVGGLSPTSFEDSASCTPTPLQTSKKKMTTSVDETDPHEHPIALSPNCSSLKLTLPRRGEGGRGPGLNSSERLRRVTPLSRGGNRQRLSCDSATTLIIAARLHSGASVAIFSLPSFNDVRTNVLRQACRLLSR